MATEAIKALSPHRSLDLGGFDRRGCSASLTGASATGITCKGQFADLADFVTFYLFRKHDLYGHLQTTKALPASSLAGVVLDFDAAASGLQSPTSFRFQSVPWGSLSWIKDNGTAGTTPLQPLITSASGQVPASRVFTVNGTPGAFDRCQLIFQGNSVFDHIYSSGGTSAVASDLTNQINGANWNSIAPALALIATASGSNFTVYAAVYGTVNTSGTTVTFATGQNFLDTRAGDPICINHVLYTISTVNSPTSITLTATAGTQTAVQFTAPGGGNDGNLIQFQELHKTSTLFITPAGAPKLTGGLFPTSFHVTIDFTAKSIDSLQELWLTLAPALPFDSGGTNPSMVAYAASNFSLVISNWATTDPSSNLVRKIAGPGTVTMGRNDRWVSYAGTGWAEYPSPAFGINLALKGFGKRTTTPGDVVTIAYDCPVTHDLWLGTVLAKDGGKLTVVVDGSVQPDADTYMNAGGQIQGRVFIASGIAAGHHVVTLTLKTTSNPLSSGTTFWFDCFQAVIATDVQDPIVTYPNTNVAVDMDTAAGLIPPERVIWILQRAGYTGDIDFYAGVFFALKRVRQGGSFHAATVTLGGTFGTGGGFGGDVVWITVGGYWPNSGTTISGETTTGGNPTGGVGLGGTVFGVAVFPADTLTTLVQRIANAINCSFVGIRAVVTGAGVVAITVLTPINGFSLDVSLSTGATGTLAVAGDIGVKTGSYIIGGQEGTWATDDTQASPLNNSFTTYLTDFSVVTKAAGISFTLAFSQELLRPRDVNTAAGAWIQRYQDGTPVLTQTGFGSWGTGYVEAVTGSGPYTIKHTGHGYITGNFWHGASATAAAVYLITLVDADHYTLSSFVSGSMAYVPAAGDNVFIELQTSQCCFNPLTVTPYFVAFYVQATNVMSAAGIANPWEQFGEILWWFFARFQSVPISSISAVSNGTFTVTVTSGTTLTLNGTAGPTVVTIPSTTGYATGQTAIVAGASATTSGTLTGGGMAFYDAATAAAAVVALGRPLANFWNQDDDPTINSGADTTFLAGLIYAHITAITTAVLAAVAGSKFELLYPGDVTFPSCFSSVQFPFPQGGRLNHVVNLPSQFMAKTGSGLDRFKIECQWSVGYRNYINAVTSYNYPLTLTWTKSDIHCILFWSDGGCDWEREYLLILKLGYAGITLWAFDHLIRFGWSRLPAFTPSVQVTG